MTGTVCLQGGGEFSAGCREMDAGLLAASDGPVVVTALAGEVGRDYATATANGVRHYRELGGPEVLGAPDVREDPEGALRALRAARLIVLPGGSPSRLLAALTATPVGQVIADLLAAGGTVMGASAGAMVLCAWTVLPDRPGGLTLARGLGLVGAGPVGDLLVLPHWSGPAGRQAWLDQVPAGTTVLGLPEESGVVVHAGVLTAVGRSASTVMTTAASTGTTDSRDLAPGQTWEHP